MEKSRQKKGLPFWNHRAVIAMGDSILCRVSPKIECMALPHIFKVVFGPPVLVSWMAKIFFATRLSVFVVGQPEKFNP